MLGLRPGVGLIVRRALRRLRWPAHAAFLTHLPQLAQRTTYFPPASSLSVEVFANHLLRDPKSLRDLALIEVAEVV